jgi:hypothetical protein
MKTRRRFDMEDKLYKILIFPKNKKESNITILDNVDEYYCTDKMFYAHENLSNVTHYYSLDSIEEIMVIPIQMRKDENI